MFQAPVLPCLPVSSLAQLSANLSFGPRPPGVAQRLSTERWLRQCRCFALCLLFSSQPLVSSPPCLAVHQRPTPSAHLPGEHLEPRLAAGLRPLSIPPCRHRQYPLPLASPRLLRTRDVSHVPPPERKPVPTGRAPIRLCHSVRVHPAHQLVHKSRCPLRNVARRRPACHTPPHRPARPANDRLRAAVP